MNIQPDPVAFMAVNAEFAFGKQIKKLGLNCSRVDNATDWSCGDAKISLTYLEWLLTTKPGTSFKH